MVEVQERGGGRNAHYKLTSTAMLWLQVNKLLAMPGNVRCANIVYIYTLRRNVLFYVECRIRPKLLPKFSFSEICCCQEGFHGEMIFKILFEQKQQIRGKNKLGEML